MHIAAWLLCSRCQQLPYNHQVYGHNLNMAIDIGMFCGRTLRRLRNYNVDLFLNKEVKKHGVIIRHLSTVPVQQLDAPVSNEQEGDGYKTPYAKSNLLPYRRR
ncbi:hypothetical protein EJB05_15780 [Eragrostis curvula]|uniref:Uncharacterized protein n=1 Tax=Eragrostis curvula TaxID=38414 RepID=A0A5J9VEV1_9POAL|nr:hypothetical protein EJB05_15780 [Eragrostis curvula]